MRIFHHVAMRLDNEEDRKPFLDLGMILPGGAHTSVGIAEDDPRWPRLELLVSKCKRPTLDTVTTQFSTQELDGAKFLGMIACSNRGYPEPQDQMAYLSSTYDLTDQCTHCGIGRRQVAPFRMKAPPALKDKSVLQLNWVHDEYFVTTTTWKEVFKPLGVGCVPVVENKTGDEIQSVVQLDIPQVYDLKLNGKLGTECSVCGGRKYPFVTRGFFPEPIGADAPMFKSSQYFGGFIFRLVIVSGAMYKAIKEAGLTGVKFYPCSG